MKSQLTFGSLFAGIGGIDLGLERAGFRCLWQVEIDDYANRVLARHWPDVARFKDVKAFALKSKPELRVDLVAGGFPCQDISNGGRRAGIGGARSGLWREYARIVRTLRPRFVLVENVAALRTRGLGVVLGDLAAIGYDAEWQCIPAAAVGARHIRDRLFIVAYHRSLSNLSRRSLQSSRPARLGGSKPSRELADAILTGRVPIPQNNKAQRSRVFTGSAAAGRASKQRGKRVPSSHRRPGLADGARRSRLHKAGNSRPLIFTPESHEKLWLFRDSVGRSQWGTEPELGRMASGVPDRMDRIRTLGNAVVPQVAEYIGSLIREAADRLATPRR